MRKDLYKRIVVYLAAFLLPVFAWVMTACRHGIYPFGMTSILSGDMIYQFVDYLSYFRTSVASGELLYTFSKTIGGDMAGFLAYYLLSPFNLLSLLFSRELLPLCIFIIIIVKCALMSVAFLYMLDRIYGFKWYMLFWAFTYSLSGYVAVYYQLYEYFDVFILFPLVVLSLRKIYEGAYTGRILPGYVFLLALALVINYYVGWMLCLFLFLYYIYLCVCSGFDKRNFAVFVLNSILAAMISAAVLVPAVLSMQGEKNSLHLDFYINYNPLDFFSGFYMQSFTGDIANCLPNIYCGAFAAVLSAFYFLNSKIPVRKKVSAAVLLAFLYVNLLINTLNIVWHGLNKPISYPYRYTFALIFFILVLSYEEIVYYAKPGWKVILMVFAAYVLYGIYGLVRHRVGYVSLLLEILVVLSGFAFIYLYERKRKKLFLLMVGLINFVALTKNLDHTLSCFELADMSAYMTYVNETGARIDEVKQQDGDFFRMEKYFRRSNNDPMMFDYAGLSHFSSTEKKDNISYMKRFGFRDNGNWAFYDCGATAFADSFFGVKYILSQYDSTGKPYKRFSKTSDKRYYTYINPYALPLMHTVKKEQVEYDGDPFKYQNDISHAIADYEGDIFTQGVVTRINEVGLRKTAKGYYEKIEEGAYIEYRIKVQPYQHKKLFEAYFDSPVEQSAVYYIDEEDMGEYFNKYHWNIQDLGHHREGDEISIKIYPMEERLYLSGVYLYFEDAEALERFYKAACEDKCEISKVPGRGLRAEADVNTEADTLMFAFPFEKGWQVYADGKKQNTFEVYDKFLGIKVEPGNHKIEMYYVPQGMISGVVMTIVGLVFLLAVIIRRKND